MPSAIGQEAQHCASPRQRPGLEVNETCWTESSAQKRLWQSGYYVVLNFQSSIALAIKPRALPWAIAVLGFQPNCTWYVSQIFSNHFCLTTTSIAFHLAAVFLQSP